MSDAAFGAAAGFRAAQRQPMSAARALGFVAVSAVLFSLGGLFVRSLDFPNAWTTVFYRSLSACASLTVLLAWHAKGRFVESIRLLGRPGLFVALCLSGSSVGMVLALTETSVAVVLVLFSLAPLVTALVARTVIGEHIHRVTWVAILATIVGVAIMVWGPGTSATLVGVALSLVAPICFAFGTVVIRQHSQITMVPAMLMACAINVVASAPFAAPTEVTRHDLVVLLLFGAAQLGVGLAFYAIAAPHAPAAQTALVSMLEPVLGPLWVWAFKDEYPGTAGFIGGAIVFGALGVHTVVRSRTAMRDAADATSRPPAH
jgi:drug/metabolite transporter (DMT)-like permease